MSREEEEMGLRKRFNTVDLKWLSVVGGGFLKMETDSDIEVIGLISAFWPNSCRCRAVHL